MKSPKPSWPFMESWGLYRKAIAHDGNCLFRSLSDQIYNTPDKHDEIRQKIVAYLRANREQFEAFVPFNTEQDLVRSQPNTRSRRSRRLSVTGDDWFEIYLDNMARPKTWGGEIEIRAFSEAYDKDVVIHRPMDAGQPFDQMVNNKRAHGQPRRFVHVSFGGEENHPHYESVRRIESTDKPIQLPTRPSSTIKSSRDRSNPPLPPPALKTESLDQTQQGWPGLSPEALQDFVGKARSRMDVTYTRLINGDRECSFSTSPASRRGSSSKRSREGDEESAGEAKRTLRANGPLKDPPTVVTFTTMTSTPEGLDHSLNIHIDTLPSPGTSTDTLRMKVGRDDKKRSEESKPGPPTRRRITRSHASQVLL